ncbi:MULTISPECIES: hypothetical protein [unclassified Coleofasciculus]|uniref:hypothetical protein n=1 Tax=Cyanophyceae TaxID=3028117 RepID=UPI001687FD19|nr:MULTISPECIES: hypothetical protein [unclassified Coleofasciculus]MBD1841769.1 hypothetical protein [Coleofasciculus sp. FACHB-501]
MGTASRYWLLMRIDSFGKCRTEEVESAKAFFLTQFPELSDREDMPDREIQRQLMQWFQNDDTRRQMAEVCLRCFISHQIQEFCLELEQKFGKNHDFTSMELLPLVLDSTLRSPRQEMDESRTNYPSVTARILQTFDPDKSKLSTWTVRMVKSDRFLKRFLLEHGIEQVTDWMILSYMNPGRLQRVLLEFDRTPAEINQTLQLLDSYHQIYRTQLLQHRKAGEKSRYPDPTALQLRQMAEQLSATRTISPEQILRELQELAQLLRAERLRTRKGLPLDNSGNPAEINRTSSEDDSNEQSEFLAGYHQQFNTCLAQSVKQVIQARFIYLQSKKNQKAQNFLKALHLFHCQGVPMKEIAPQLGLKDQPQVSRLLELKNLRSDIGRRTLLCLRACVLKLAQCYVNPVQLQNLESKVQLILDKEISTEIEKAKKESHIGHNRVMNSQLAATICNHLNSQKEERA